VLLKALFILTFYEGIFMANYKETIVQGAAYTRCFEVYISNHKDGVPSILFKEERVIAINGEELITKIPGFITAEFDSKAEIPLRHPYTGELLGFSMHQVDLQLLIYSLYMQKAEQRDAEQGIPLAPEPDTSV
jgi:hypothetical protein